MTPDELLALAVANNLRDVLVEDADGRVWFPTWRNIDPQNDWWHCHESHETCRTADLRQPLDVLVRVPLNEWEGPT